MGQPDRTPTESLLRLGIHNTWEELVEAHKVNQIERLKLTDAGRAVLRRLGYAEGLEKPEENKRIPLYLTESFCVAPVPRNLLPEHN